MPLNSAGSSAGVAQVEVYMGFSLQHASWTFSWWLRAPREQNWKLQSFLSARLVTYTASLGHILFVKASHKAHSQGEGK